MGNNQSEREYEEIRLTANYIFSRGTIKTSKRSSRQKEITNYRSQKRSS